VEKSSLKRSFFDRWWCDRKAYRRQSPIAQTEQQPDRVLYLAVPEDIYEDFFTRRLAQMSVTRMQLKLLVFNPVKEEVVSWK
jgi:glucose-6-phosphate 1-dehydrogenase